MTVDTQDRLVSAAAIDHRETCVCQTDRVDAVDPAVVRAPTPEPDCSQRQGSDIRAAVTQDPVCCASLTLGTTQGNVAHLPSAARSG